MKNLKKTTLSLRLPKSALMYAMMCVTMVLLTAAGCESEVSNSREGARDYERTARTLKVSIDESGLTYDDLTIHLTNGTDYVYKQVPFGTVTVSIDDLPASVAELKRLSLPQGMTGIHQSPYLQPMLIVAALNVLNTDKEEAKQMLDYIVREAKSENRDGALVHFPGQGAATAYATDWSQTNQYKNFEKVRSYLEGAKYANNYTPETKPYVMKMEINDNSYTADKDCFLLWLTSTQASSKRQIGIWEYDADGDGQYDTFWSSTYLALLHGLAEY